MREFYKKFIAPNLPEVLRFKLRFYSKHGYWPDLKRPRSLMEKIVWLLRNDRTPLRAEVVDRIKVRDFVRQHAPECRLPQNLWVGEDFTQAVWANLPQRFVIKGNHGSQMTKIVDKGTTTYEEVRRATLDWLAIDYSHLFGEWVYAHAEKLLVVEERLQFDSVVPPDWKFMCGNGRVIMVQLDVGRFSDHRRNLYDRDFKLFENAALADLQNVQATKPSAWGKAVLIAEKLAKPFDFIRVDLYIIDDEVYFGELTNYPGAGGDSIRPKELDFYLGSQFQLDAIRSKI